MTTYGSSSTSATTSIVPASSVTIWVRRGALCASRIATSSSRITLISTSRLARMRFSSLTVASSSLRLLVELLAAELREPAERHVEDVVGLDLGELERLAPSARRAPRPRSFDARIAFTIASIMSSAFTRPSTMCSRSSRLLQPELRAPGDDDDLMVEPVLQRLLQVDRARHVVDERDHVDRERASARPCA